MWMGEASGPGPGLVANPDRVPGTQSRWSAGKDLSFVPLRPQRVIEVRYDYRTTLCKLRATKLVAHRPHLIGKPFVIRIRRHAEPCLTVQHGAHARRRRNAAGCRYTRRARRDGLAGNTCLVGVTSPQRRMPRDLLTKEEGSRYRDGNDTTYQEPRLRLHGPRKTTRNRQRRRTRRS